MFVPKSARRHEPAVCVVSRRSGRLLERRVTGCQSDLRYVALSRRDAAECQRCRIGRSDSRRSPVTVHAMARQTRVGEIARGSADSLPISRARCLVSLPRRLEQSGGVLHPVRTLDRNGLSVLAQPARREQEQRGFSERHCRIVDVLPPRIQAGTPLDPVEARPARTRMPGVLC